MNFYDVSFCPKDTRYPYTPLVPACDYTKVEPPYTAQPDRSAAFSVIRGTVTGGNIVYSTSKSNCVAYYEIIVETESGQSVALIVTSNTYPIDCGPVTVGTRVLAFYTSLAENLQLSIPAYDVIVICFDLPERNVKTDFFDCYLLSQDTNLKLNVGSNTYVVDRNGHPYCGTLSNKYLIVLYDIVNDSQPPTTQPNVVIVL